MEPVQLTFGEATWHLGPKSLDSMKFTLVYDDNLPSSGNKGQPVEASKIRNKLHDQLADLWNNHVVFRELKWTARTRGAQTYLTLLEPAQPPTLPDYLGEVGMSRCLLNIAKRSLPELILSGVGLASKAAAG